MSEDCCTPSGNIMILAPISGPGDHPPPGRSRPFFLLWIGGSFHRKKEKEPMPSPRIGPLAFMALLISTLFFQQALAQDFKTVEATFPGLASGLLKTAYVAKLPPGTLLTGGKMIIKEADLDQIVSKEPAPLQAQLRKNGFFLLENAAVKSLLLQEARTVGHKKTKDEER